MGCKRAVIAFTVEAKQVSILGVFYGGQDFETALHFEREAPGLDALLAKITPENRHPDTDWAHPLARRFGDHESKL